MIGDPRRYFIDLACGGSKCAKACAAVAAGSQVAEKQKLRVEECCGSPGLAIFRKLFDELKARKQAVDSTGLNEMTA
jgi:hypothetical protein